MARGFEFRLEKLLEIRRSREDLARRDLAAAQKAVAAQNQIILAILAEEDQGRKALAAIKRGTIDVPRLRLHEGYQGTLERRLRREREKLQELARAELEKRRALVEARKGVRVLERFREKEFRAWMGEQDREERKFLDEVGQSRQGIAGLKGLV